ncbi:MAG: phage tail tape measure C-terminal domain-containing protein [Pseudomonadota bacterium]
MTLVLNARFVADASDMRREVRGASKDVARLGTAARATGTAAHTGASGIRKIETSSQTARPRLKKLGDEAKATGGRFAALKSVLLGVATSLGFRALIQTNRQFQDLKASLVTVTGSAEKADAAFGALKDFTSRTPYQLEEVVGGFIKLKALGLEPSIAALQSYGNTAAAMGKDLNQMIEAVADASVGEFERLKEFGIKARSEGDSVSLTFAGVTTTVAKNAADIQAYLRSIGDVRFAGAMDERMKVLSGTFSNFTDNVKSFLARIGDAGFNEAFGGLTTDISASVEASTALADTIGKGLTAAVESLRAGFAFAKKHADELLLVLYTVGGTKVLAGLNALTAAIGRIGAAMIAMSLSNPFTAVALAATAGVAALVTYRNEVITLGGHQARLVDFMVAGWDIAREGVARMWEGIKSFGTRTLEVARDVRDWYVGIWTKILGAAKKGINVYIGLWVALWDTVNIVAAGFVDAFKGAIDYLGGLFTDFGKLVKASITLDFDEAGRIAGEMFEREFVNGFDGAGGKIKEAMGEAINVDYVGKVTEGIGTIADGVGDTLKSAWQTAQDAVTPIITQIGTDAAQRYKDSLAQGLEQDAQGIATDLSDPNAEDAARKEEELKRLKEAHLRYGKTRLEQHQADLKAASQTWQAGLVEGINKVRADAQNLASLTSNAVTGAFGKMEDALVDFTMTGKLNFKGLVNSILTDIARIQIRKSITEPLANMFGNIVGGMFGGGKAAVAHTGGIIGTTSLPTRTVNRITFDHAPRLHTGGMIGSGEVPTILKAGEGVFTPQQMQNADRLLARIGNRPPVAVNVQIINNAPEVQTRVEDFEREDGGVDLQVFVEAAEGHIADNLQQRRGPVAGVLGSEYGMMAGGR